MTQSSLNTQQLNRWLERIRGGDLAARDELLRGVGDRLERLARKMLARYPNVRRWADADDVLQNATLRLLHSLEHVQPANVREFFALAATHIRRELLDLARHFFGKCGIGAHHDSVAPRDAAGTPAAEPPAQAADAGELEEWCAFHETVERLPVEEREVVGLIFYHGWTHAQVAVLFGITERSVRRRWASALYKLHGTLAGDPGEDEGAGEPAS